MASALVIRRKLRASISIGMAAIALIIGATFSAPRAGAYSTAPNARTFGLLVLGLPSFTGQRPGCLYCTLSRSAPSSDFTAIEHPLGGPSRILLMRHADKPDDPDNPDLSEAGAARAKQLAQYIPQTFGKPDFIFATARSKHSDRPLETVEPLAGALGMKIENDIDNDDFEDLAEELLNDPDYKGKTIVICWHHGKIPALATLLGAPAGTFPDPWPEDTYNIILDFHYNPNSGDPPTVTRVDEPF